MAGTDELLVDVRDRHEVTRLLAEVPGLAVSVADTSAALGLARLTVAGPGGGGLAGVVDRVRGEPGTAEALRAEFGGGDPASPLDVLITLVRHRARAAYGGWCPVVDRDHDVGAVRTNPHVKIAVETPPEPLDPVTAADRLPPGRPDGPVVGIADAAVYAHPDLAGRFLGRPVTGPGPFPATGPGHAAFVAGTVLRRHPAARLVCRDVLRHGEPNRSWEVATRLVGFLDDGVEVLNMSFGCLTDGPPPLALSRAVARLAGTAVLVAALGNYEEGNDPHRPHYPAADPAVVAVGAAEAGGAPAAITPDVPWLDLLAPGVAVPGPFLIGEAQVAGQVQAFPTGYVRWSGSSFAAAAVTGEIARRMAERGVDAGTARDELLDREGGDGVLFRHV